MKILPLIITLASLFAAVTAQASEDTQPPAIDVSSISPALGEEATGGTVVVSGTVTDTADSGTAGIDKVYYRLQGSRTWHRAILTAQGAATTTYIFTFKIKKGKNKRFYIRVFDLCGNESDTIGRRIFRPRVQPREPATATDPGDGAPPVVAPLSVGTPGFLSQSSLSQTDVPAAGTASREGFGPDEEIPTAKPTSRSSSIVVSPYFPRIELDVSGFSSGDIATDPRNGLPFLIP